VLTRLELLCATQSSHRCHAYHTVARSRGVGRRGSNAFSQGSYCPAPTAPLLLEWIAGLLERRKWRVQSSVVAADRARCAMSTWSAGKRSTLNESPHSTRLCRGLDHNTQEHTADQILKLKTAEKLIDQGVLPAVELTTKLPAAGAGLGAKVWLRGQGRGGCLSSPAGNSWAAWHGWGTPL